MSRMLGKKEIIIIAILIVCLAVVSIYTTINAAKDRELDKAVEKAYKRDPEEANRCAETYLEDMERSKAELDCFIKAGK